MKIVMRIAGGALGIAGLAFGLYFFTLDEYGVARRAFVGVGFVGTGIYLLNYALTGRQTLLRRKERFNGDKN